jgi:hypothetical protein
MTVKIGVLGESNKKLNRFYGLVALCFIITIGLIITHLVEDKTCENIFDDPKMITAYLIGSVGLIVTLYITFKNNNATKFKNIMNKLK